MRGLECVAVATAVLGPPKKKSGGESLWLCPRHGDSNPSLKINTYKNCWGCFVCDVRGDASGGPWALIEFLGGPGYEDKKAVAKWLEQHGLGNGNRKKIVSTYDYKDEDGNLLFQAVRFHPKTFSLRRPDGAGGWI